MKNIMKKQKLNKLADIEGMTVTEMIKEASMDTVAKAICMNQDCSYTTTMEPDQDAGYCEVCGTNTVTSCLVLAGIL